MPEGHTIHRIARDHQKWFAGQSIVAMSPQGRFAPESRRITGKTFVSANAFGKHLIYCFGNPDSGRQLHVHIHLGLYGKFRVHSNPPPEPKGAVRLRMIGKARSFDLNGPNRCEIISNADLNHLRSRLGEDPLNHDADPEKVWKRIQKSSAAIGSLLLNQSVIAGIGNVYRADLLFLLGIHPNRKGKELSQSEFDQLWELTVRLMKVGVKYNRIITADPKTFGTSYSRIKAQERLVCYKKKRCIQCGTNIEVWTLAARTMYACSNCQS